jgi:hypothetical protein
MQVACTLAQRACDRAQWQGVGSCGCMPETYLRVEVESHLMNAEGLSLEATPGMAWAAYGMQTCMPSCARTEAY